MTPGRHFTGARTPRFALLTAAAAIFGAAGCNTTKPPLPKPPAGTALNLPKPSNVDNTPHAVPAKPAAAPSPVSVRRPEPTLGDGPLHTAPGISLGSTLTPNDRTSGAGGLTAANGPERIPANVATMPLSKPAGSTVDRMPTPPAPPAVPEPAPLASSSIKMPPVVTAGAREPQPTVAPSPLVPPVIAPGIPPDLPAGR